MRIAFRYYAYMITAARIAERVTLAISFTM